MERIVGIDLGIRSKHRAAVFDGVNPRGKAFSVEVSREGFDKLLEKAKEETEGPVRFVFEPTGLAWMPLAAYVTSAGHLAYMVKPQKVHDLRQFLRKHTKSDVVDAAVLARIPVVSPETLSELAVPTAEQTTLKRLVGQRERMVKCAGDHRRWIWSLLDMVNPALKEVLAGDAIGKLVWLNIFPFLSISTGTPVFKILSRTLNSSTLNLVAVKRIITSCLRSYHQGVFTVILI